MHENRLNRGLRARQWTTAFRANGLKGPRQIGKALGLTVTMDIEGTESRQPLYGYIILGQAN
jgi:predicted AAA+ superfamily ATPase